MAIDLKVLTEERIKLKKDFDELSTKITTIDKELITMRNNLNALYGALQQTDKLIKMSTAKDDKQLLTEKEDD